jgi:lysophospholipase L1-like esterase
VKVICYGDSNTYGYDPRGYFGGRYDAGSRWVDILAARTGWAAANLGQNGREIPAAAPEFPADTDLLIVMLGTNDLLQGCSPEEAAKHLERFLSGITLDRRKLMLIAPPPMALGEWVPELRLVQDSQAFARCCEALAGRLGIPFADAGKWDIPLSYDGVHFTEQGHRSFAEGLLEVLLRTKSAAQ